MTITKTTAENTLILALEGRLDTMTAPQLEDIVKEGLDGITTLILDMEKLVYLSSAGLRVILAAQKKMNKQGSMTVRHVNETIMEIFEITGFTDILSIES